MFSSVGEKLDYRSCESLEEVFKRVQFKVVDLEQTNLDEDVSAALFLPRWVSYQSHFLTSSVTAGSFLLFLFPSLKLSELVLWRARRSDFIYQCRYTMKRLGSPLVEACVSVCEYMCAVLTRFVFVQHKQISGALEVQSVSNRLLEVTPGLWLLCLS